jgi:hypothetical protein
MKLLLKIWLKILNMKTFWKELQHLLKRNILIGKINEKIYIKFTLYINLLYVIIYFNNILNF